MMTPLGYEVVYYGVGLDGYTIGATAQVQVLSPDEQVALLGHDFSDITKYHGDDANIGNALYQEFNRRLCEILPTTVAQGDIVLYPFGIAHAATVGSHQGFSVESGIGYPDTFLPFRIFESYAWMHYHQGKYARQGANYEWVIPNYFVAEDWTMNTTPDEYLLYFGRLNDLKGLPTVVEIARKLPHKKILICGQGDPTPYLTEKNIHYVLPKHGKERDQLLGQAEAVLMPSAFTEPFGGVAVEAMLCGTPVISTSFGAFTETIEQGKTGFRCHTLGDWLKALALVPSLDRQYISERARSLYALEAVAPQYDKVFRQVADLATTGWYSEHSHWIT